MNIAIGAIIGAIVSHGTISPETAPARLHGV